MMLSADKLLLADLYAGRDRLVAAYHMRRVMVEAFDRHPSDLRLAAQLDAEVLDVDAQIARLMA